MNKLFILLLFVFNISVINTYAQEKASVNQRFRIALFAPLYLDSVFADGKLKSEKSIPKFIMPSVEFIQGAQIALDSLELTSQHVEAYIYDTRSTSEGIQSLFQHSSLDSVNLYIGSVKDKEYKQLADLALHNKTPFISTTYPNDGNVTDNPYVFIVNSTLKAHIEGIYSYLLENHGTDRIYLCRKRGQQEDKIAAYLKMINEQEGKPLLNIQTINFDSSVSPTYFKYKLDSLVPSVIIGGSLDEDFAASLTDASFYVFKKNYPITLIGMPNWDGFKAFIRKDAYKDFAIHFTSPYYNSKSEKNYNLLSTEYMKRFKSKPSDMACKGFEAVQYFVSILLNYPTDFISNINDKTFRVFSEYNFRPVYLKKKSGSIDYYENKHLYVMKIVNGAISREW